VETGHAAEPCPSSDRHIPDLITPSGLWEVWASLGDVQGPVGGLSVHRAGTFHRPCHQRRAHQIS
jgi:hypothetical protein